MGRPEITATSANGRARSANSAGTPGRGRAPVGSGTMAASVPSKSRNSALVRRIGRHAAEQGAGAPPRPRRRRRGQRQGAVVVVVVEARSCPMTTITSRPRRRADRRGRRDGRTWAGFTPMARGDGRRLLLLARRVVHGRGRLVRGGVDGRLHLPPAGADHRRVVGGQPVGARGVGHHHADRAGRDRASWWSCSPALGARGGWSWWWWWWWWWPAPSSSSTLRRRARWSAGGGHGGLGAARRAAHAGAGPDRNEDGDGDDEEDQDTPRPARRRANRTCPSGAARHPLGVQPALRPSARRKPLRWWGGGSRSGGCSLGASARVAQSVEHFTCNALGGLPRRTV